MAIEDATVAAFAGLFAGRADAYGAFSKPNGGEYVKRAEPTPYHYARHLRGNASLGIFPLRDDGTASFGMTDVDNPADPAAAFADARRVARSLAEQAHVTGWIERSRGKGYHIWTFHPAGTRAAAIRRAHRDACRAAGLPDGTEVFPKQDTLANGGLGNFCNLPYYGEGGDRRVIVDEEGGGVALADFLARAVQQPLADAAPAVQEPPRILPAMRSPDTGPRPACMQAIIDRSREPDLFVGQRNEALIRLAAYEVGTAQHPDAGVLVEEVGRNLGLDDAEIRHVHQMAQRGYIYGCDRKREIRACAAACTWDACRFHPGGGAVVPDAPAEEIAATPDDHEEDEQPGEALPAATYDEDTVTRRTPQGWVGAVADYLVETRGVSRAVAYWAALTCAGAALGNRVWFKGMDRRDAFPHLWTALLGASGTGKSSTASSVLEFAALPDHRTLSEAGTIESWLVSLSAESARLMYQDELANLLVSFKLRGMERSKPTFAKLFSAGRLPVRYQSLARGEVVVTDPALSILGCSTIEWFQENITSYDFTSGLMARWLLVQLDGTYDETTPRHADDPEREAHLRRWIVGVQTTVRGEVHVPAELRAEIGDWARERKERTFPDVSEEASGFVQRLSLYALKIATILYCTDDPGEPLVLTRGSVEGAITLLDWLAPRMVALIGGGIAEGEFGQRCQRVRNRLRKLKGQPVSWSQLRRSFGWEGRAFNEVIAVLQEQRRVVVEEQRNPNKPGRPARVVRSIEKAR